MYAGLFGFWSSMVSLPPDSEGHVAKFALHTALKLIALSKTWREIMFKLRYRAASDLSERTPERVVCERNRDPRITTTPAGGLSL